MNPQISTIEYPVHSQSVVKIINKESLIRNERGKSKVVMSYQTEILPPCIIPTLWRLAPRNLASRELTISRYVFIWVSLNRWIFPLGVRGISSTKIIPPSSAL